MDNRGDQRPPRSARPAAPHPTAAPASNIPDYHWSLVPDSQVVVSFNNVEQGDRNTSLDGQRHRSMPSAYQPHFNNDDPELTDHLDPTKVGRKKYRMRQQGLGHCLQDLATIGFINTSSIGCLASSVVLYLSFFSLSVLLLSALSWSCFSGSSLGSLAIFLGRHTSKGCSVCKRLKIGRTIAIVQSYRPAPSALRPRYAQHLTCSVRFQAVAKQI